MNESDSNFRPKFHLFHLIGIGRIFSLFNWNVLNATKKAGKVIHCIESGVFGLIIDNRMAILRLCISKGRIWFCHMVRYRRFLEQRIHVPWMEKMETYWEPNRHVQLFGVFGSFDRIKEGEARWKFDHKFSPYLNEILLHIKSKLRFELLR